MKSNHDPLTQMSPQMLASEIEAMHKRILAKTPLVKKSVVILCGPTYCGKSTWASHYRSLVMRSLGWSVEIVSSDQIRAGLMRAASDAYGYPDADVWSQVRHFDSMLSVSTPAFQMLSARVKALTTFPVNIDVVVVDTTGMNEAFREEMLSICRDNNYQPVLVTFEYKGASQYLADAQGDMRRAIIDSVSRYKERVLPNLKLPRNALRFRIPERQFLEPTWTRAAGGTGDILLAPEFDLLRTPKRYVSNTWVIGDSHECVEELQFLVEEVKKTQPDVVNIALLGDYLDKGGNTAAMVNYLHAWKNDRVNFPRVDILKANHEAYVYRRLKGEVEANPELEAAYFTSIPVLEADEALREKFFELYDSSLDSLVLKANPKSGARPAFITHAPCQNRDIGKTDQNSLRAQRNFRFLNRSEQEGELPSVRKQLEFIYNEADLTHPWHVFGHIDHLVSSPRDIVFKNKVFLDTAAVKGGKLTAVSFRSGQPEFLHVDCSHRRGENWAEVQAETCHSLATPEKKVVPFRIEDYDFTKAELRVMANLKRGLRYVSGTMSPGPSADGKLETLEGALKYLESKGVKRISAQPKYMGSRAQAYFYAETPWGTWL